MVACEAQQYGKMRQDLRVALSVGVRDFSQSCGLNIITGRKAWMVVTQLSSDSGSLSEACASARFAGLLIADPSTASELLALRSDTPAITWYSWHTQTLHRTQS